MKRYDILFFKGTSLISKLIRLFTKSKYSHTALVIDRHHLFETDWKYNSMIRHIEYRSKEYDLYRYEQLDFEQEKKIEEFINNQFRRKYDYKYLFSRLLYILFRLKVRNDKCKFTCDELIVEAFEWAGIKLLEKQTILTPQKLSESKYLTKL